MAATEGGIEFTFRKDSKKKTFSSYSSKDYTVKAITIIRQPKREKLLYAIEAQRALQSLE